MDDYDGQTASVVITFIIGFFLAVGIPRLLYRCCKPSDDEIKSESESESESSSKSNTASDNPRKLDIHIYHHHDRNKSHQDDNENIHIYPHGQLNIHIYHDDSDSGSGSGSDSNYDPDDHENNEIINDNDCDPDDYEYEILPDHDPDSDSDSDTDTVENQVTMSDEDLIAHVRESSKKSHAVLSRNELSGEQGVLENMAETLISVSKELAHSLDNTKHIPENKKQEITNLLKGVPELISQIVDMDDNEFDTLLKRNNPFNTVDNVEDRNKETEILMKTLESLRH